MNGAAAEDWKIWKDFIDRRIRQNTHFNVMIDGAPGTGKSWIALRLAEVLDETFHQDRIAFSVGDFISKLKKEDLQPGQVMIFEEAGVGADSRSALSTANKTFGAMMQIIRSKRLIFILTAPDQSYVDKRIVGLMQARWTTSGINRKKGLSRINVKLIKKSLYAKGNDSSYVFLRRKKEATKVPIKYLTFTRPALKLRRFYENAKAEFQKDFLNISTEKLVPSEKLSPMEAEVYKCRKEHPDWSISKMAEHLGRPGRAVSASIIKMRKMKGYEIDSKRTIQASA